MKERAMMLSIFALSMASVCFAGTASAQSDTMSGSSQQTPGALVAQNQSPQYVVYFELGESTLNEEARATVASAAQEYQRTGSARLSVRAHTDTSGSASFNQALSEQRQQAVVDELVQQGVPADAISGIALGETELAVPTDDNVREAENRRVEITVEQPAPPPAPAPEPVPAPAPQVVTTPPEPQPQLERGAFSIGGFYGYNLGDETGTSHLGGINLGLDYAVTPWLGAGIEQAGFYHFGTDSEGFGGRTAGSVDFLIGTTNVMGGTDITGHFGANVGYLYGSGIEDDFFAGPEIGLTSGPFVAKVAYDIPFNRSLDEGIIATTIGFGIRF